MNNKKGFTLVELLAVITILGIISSFAIVSVTRYLNQAKTEAYRDFELSTKNAAKDYYIEYPYELSDAPGRVDSTQEDYTNANVTVLPLRVMIDNENIEEMEDPNKKDAYFLSGAIYDFETLNSQSYVAVFRYADVFNNYNLKYKVCLRGSMYHTTGGSIGLDSSFNALGDDAAGCLNIKEEDYKDFEDFKAKIKISGVDKYG